MEIKLHAKAGNDEENPLMLQITCAKTEAKGILLFCWCLFHFGKKNNQKFISEFLVKVSNKNSI